LKKPEGTLTFHKEFTRQEPIPDEGIQRAVELMQSGRLHRYNVLAGEESDVSLLEKDFAAYMGTRYCAALNSCGSAIYVALVSAGVRPGDRVLTNTFTLAPVPGAIQNAGAECILVDITEDYIVDLNHLEQKARESQAKFFLISHMRGHIADLDQVSKICEQHGICLIEDCAHTAGAGWNQYKVGTFGTAACFSTQTYKHMNSGEGGLLVTNDEDLAAKAILYSGSYMLYERHGARPDLEVFERHKLHIPNFSLRMSNLQAALIRPQLRILDEQCRRWNARHDLIIQELAASPHIRLPRRDPREAYVGSSVQFSLNGMTSSLAEDFLARCAERGVEVKWFGRRDPHGFTSSYRNWQYLPSMPELPASDQVLEYLFDFRVPLTFTLEDCRLIAAIIKQVLEELSSEHFNTTTR
jgi:dTDP-4-amino-4,6-dideoxygalactose transaminase